MEFTEAQYDQLLEAVDPDDIKAMWDLTKDREIVETLFDLHEESMKVLDYMGAPEFSEVSVRNLATFFDHVYDLICELQEQPRANAAHIEELIEELNAFYNKAPASLHNVLVTA